MASNWGALSEYGRSHALRPGNLIWLVLLLPLIKIIHAIIVAAMVPCIC